MIETWRFETTVLSEMDLRNILYKWDNPVFVYSGQTLIGCALLEILANQLVARAFLDYSIPERLDVQNGEKWWLLPYVNVNLATLASATKIHIKALQLRNDCLDPTLAPIGVV